MTDPMPAQQREHYERIMKELNDDLVRMQLKYDSKYLAVALLTKATYLLQLLQAAKVWSQDEVSAIVQASFADVHEPINMPTIMTLDADGTRRENRPS